MDVFSLFQTAYAAVSSNAVLNATIPIIQIPAKIIPQLGPDIASQTYGVVAPTAATNSSSGIFDLTTISGVAALGTSIYAFFKDRLGNKTMEHRSNALVGNDQRLLSSQKSTDLAAEDTSVGINALIMKLKENPDIAKLLDSPTTALHGIDGKSVAQFFNDDKNEWKDSNTAYYDNKTPIPETNSKDPIIQKSSEIAQLTTPTPT